MAPVSWPVPGIEIYRLSFILVSDAKPLSLFHIMQVLTGVLLSLCVSLASSTLTLPLGMRPMSLVTVHCPHGVNPHSLCFTVVLMATSPAYFRGFTLIALKEGREGTTDDDYTGQFQVGRRSRCGEGREDRCMLKVL